MSSLKSVDLTTPASTNDGAARPGELPLFEPYESPAGGWSALQATAKALRDHHDLKSKTPAAKSIPVLVRAQ